MPVDILFYLLVSFTPITSLQHDELCPPHIHMLSIHEPAILPYSTSSTSAALTPLTQSAYRNTAITWEHGTRHIKPTGVPQAITFSTLHPSLQSFRPKPLIFFPLHRPKGTSRICHIAKRASAIRCSHLQTLSASIDNLTTHGSIPSRPSMLPTPSFPSNPCTR